MAKSLITATTLFIGIFILTVTPINVSAAPVVGFEAGRIIDDAVFTNKQSRSVAQIQEFLNSKVPVCDTQHSGYYGQSGTFYGPSFICLKDFYENYSSTYSLSFSYKDKQGNTQTGTRTYFRNNAYEYKSLTAVYPDNPNDLNNTSYSINGNYAYGYLLKGEINNINGTIPSGAISAAQIIYNTAQEFNINPQVLIVLLQKEQSLITDTWPEPYKYQSATGYGCPDTSPCSAGYAGFTNQVRNAAEDFHLALTPGSSYWSGWLLNTNNQIPYSTSSSCGSSNVYIQNRATWALYTYTPYQPNSATLNAGYASGGNCSVGGEGNRNFYQYFKDWFGPTTASPIYGYSIVSQKAYSDSGYQSELPSPLNIQPNSEAYIKIVIKNTGNQTWYKNSLHMGTTSPMDRYSRFHDSSWLGPNRPAEMLEESVAPDENATLRFKLDAPGQLGSYNESFGILIEGQLWLNGDISLPINISSPVDYYSVETTSFKAFSDIARTKELDNYNISNFTRSKIYIRAIIKNTGNKTFPASLTKIAPTQPNNRASIFADDSWANSSRVTAAKEGDILPQATGTFDFSITLPDQPIINTTEKFGMLIESQVWLSDDIGTLTINSRARPAPEILKYQTLEIGQYLLSYDERFRLILQGDGNLVLYSPSRAIWSTGTAGKGGAHLAMQDDGNLVLYRYDWKPLWQTGTSGKNAQKFIIQTDGNLVLYSSNLLPQWDSHTDGKF